MQPALDKTEQNWTAPNENPAEELSPRQVEVLAILADGNSIAEASRRTGVSRTTVHDWLNRNPVFATGLNRIKAERLESLRSDIHSLAAPALETLRGVLTDAEQPAAVRLKAALAVLDRVGAGQPEVIGPTDPSVIRRERQRTMMRDSLDLF